MRVGRTGPYLVAGLSKGARAGPLGAKLESVVILLEILWRLDHRGHLRSEFTRLLAGRAQIGWIRGRDGFRFGACEVDLMRQELRRAGTVVPLEPQVFDVLAYLLAPRPDRQQARAVRIRLARADRIGLRAKLADQRRPPRDRRRWQHTGPDPHGSKACILFRGRCACRSR